MYFSRKKATAVFKTRSDMLDPAPREPKWDCKWKCIFCWSRSQTSKHYITECQGTKKIFENDEERWNTWNIITRLDTDLQTIDIAAEKCKDVMNLIEEMKKKGA